MSSNTFRIKKIELSQEYQAKYMQSHLTALRTESNMGDSLIRMISSSQPEEIPKNTYLDAIRISMHAKRILRQEQERGALAKARERARAEEAELEVLTAQASQAVGIDQPSTQQQAVTDTAKAAFARSQAESPATGLQTEPSAQPAKSVETDVIGMAKIPGGAEGVAVAATTSPSSPAASIKAATAGLSFLV